jgi:hypothetical protein
MSFTLEVRGSSSASWPLTTSCLDQIEQLRSAGSSQEIACLVGDEQTQNGTYRTVSKQDLSRAIEALIPLAKKLKGGFVIHVPSLYPEFGPSTATGAGGMLINGKHHTILCEGTYWTLQTLEDAHSSKPKTPRSDEADIVTENHGVYKIRRRKSSNSDLAKLLKEILRHLDDEQGETLMVVWG